MRDFQDLPDVLCFLQHKDQNDNQIHTWEYNIVALGYLPGAEDMEHVTMHVSG